MEKQAAYMEHCADQLESRLRTRIPEDVQVSYPRFDPLQRPPEAGPFLDVQVSPSSIKR